MMGKFKVGDRVLLKRSHRQLTAVIREFCEDGYTITYDHSGCDGSLIWRDDELELIAPAGPVREVTRKEIVPGVYGRVVISPHAETSVTHVGVTFEPIIGHGFAALSAPELRAAADVLTQLADALEPKP